MQKETRPNILVTEAANRIPNFECQVEMFSVVHADTAFEQTHTNNENCAETSAAANYRLEDFFCSFDFILFAIQLTF